jgi:integrase
MYQGKLQNQSDLEKNVLDFYSNKRCYHIRFALKYFFDFWDKVNGTELSNGYITIIKDHKYLFREKVRMIIKKFISKEDLKKLLDMLDAEIQLFFQIQYETSCRAGALIKLCVHQVEVKENRRTITIKEKRDSIYSYILSEELSNKLREHIKDKSLIANVWTFSFSSVSNQLKKKSVEVLGYPISTHWIRSSRAVHLFQDGYDILTIKELLKHKKLETTYRYLMDAGIKQEDLVTKDKMDWLYKKDDLQTVSKQP